MITYLNVPYAEKDRAKRSGARFDMSRKQWYVPDGIDLCMFMRWVPKEAFQFQARYELAMSRFRARKREERRKAREAKAQGSIGL